MRLWKKIGIVGVVTLAAMHGGHTHQPPSRGRPEYGDGYQRCPAPSLLRLPLERDHVALVQQGGPCFLAHPARRLAGARRAQFLGVGVTPSRPARDLEARVQGGNRRGRDAAVGLHAAAPQRGAVGPRHGEHSVVDDRRRRADTVGLGAALSAPWTARPEVAARGRSRAPRQTRPRGPVLARATGDAARVHREARHSWRRDQ